MKLTVLGPPVTKKNSPRIIRGKGGKPRLIPSARAVSWQASAALQLESQFRGRRTIDVPCGLRALVYRARKSATWATTWLPSAMPWRRRGSSGTTS